MSGGGGGGQGVPFPPDRSQGLFQQAAQKGPFSHTHTHTHTRRRPLCNTLQERYKQRKGFYKGPGTHVAQKKGQTTGLSNLCLHNARNHTCVSVTGQKA